MRASGCTATLNGRSWFSITGVVSRNSGREAFRAGPRLRANGWSACSVVVLAVAKAWTLVSVCCVCRNVGGNSVRVCSSWVSLAAIAEKLVSDALMSEASSFSTPPKALVTRLRLWMARRMLRWRVASSVAKRCGLAVQAARSA